MYVLYSNYVKTDPQCNSSNQPTSIRDKPEEGIASKDFTLIHTGILFDPKLKS